MGCFGGLAHPNGFNPNGLLADEAASVTRFLDPDRWSIVEERTVELITCMQPNQLSEEHRNAVASYVHWLIRRCFSCQKISFRDRHPSSGRNRGNYGYDRNDHYVDREGSWNINSKQKFSGHGRGRIQVEKPNTRIDRTTASNRRSDRPWDAFKQAPVPSNLSQNSLFSSSNSTSRGSSNVAYGMYPPQVMNPNGVSPGTAVPSVFMLYPYDQNMTCGSAEQLEFGSLGTVHFSGMCSW